MKLTFYYFEPLSYNNNNGNIIVNRYSVMNLKHCGFDWNKSPFIFDGFSLNVEGDIIIRLKVIDSFHKSERFIYINSNKETFINRNKLKWYCSLFWIQKEDNIRYVINIFFLILGSYLTYKQL